MTRIASLKLAAAFVAVLSVPSLAMAQSAGGGGSAGGDGGLMSAPEISHINLPPTVSPSRGETAAVAQRCSFELIRGHFCEPARTR
ncbi:MAG: hypothetical protein JNK84_06150 [Phreatobacter sp.]|uniref:hypothetical protein n=1 Tax=Phreatobacter sp. TaxID=1966341 RepID=UPI001A403D23|nr:hypothetical protein [Phreatobacter sp.]MBL8568650.1 hypothetical protein [Phreatobacter sp.]